MKYGVDVAVQRADDLDKLMMQEVIARVVRGEIPTVLDIGSGAGGQSLRLAKLGASVFAVDVSDHSAEFAKLKKSDDVNMVSFVQADITEWIKGLTTDFDLVCFQRTLHYLPYEEAKQFLKTLRNHTKGQLYLSVTGATSAIAKEYAVLDTPIEERFAVLSKEAQGTFFITAPLCIYHESELLTLLESAGWGVVWSRVSDFGNIKLIAITK